MVSYQKSAVIPMVVSQLVIQHFSLPAFSLYLIMVCVGMDLCEHGFLFIFWGFSDPLSTTLRHTELLLKIVFCTIVSNPLSKSMDSSLFDIVPQILVALLKKKIPFCGSYYIMYQYSCRCKKLPQLVT